MSTDANPPPGWYPSEGGQRYWDGAQWVGEVASIQTAELVSVGTQEIARSDASEGDKKRRFGKTEEEKAARQSLKEMGQAQREVDKRVKQEEQAQQAFLLSPVGKARTAYGRGDAVFQYELDVMRQQAIIVAMMGSSTSKKSTDPSEVLNAVCREGWELVNGSFVFIHEGEQSRDKLLSSGQNTSVKGRTMGYYLFRRSQINRVGGAEIGG